MVSQGSVSDSDGIPRYMQDGEEWFEDTEDGFSFPKNGVGVYSKNGVDDCYSSSDGIFSPRVAQEWVKIRETDLVNAAYPT